MALKRIKRTEYLQKCKIRAGGDMMESMQPAEARQFHSPSEQGQPAPDAPLGRGYQSTSYICNSHHL